MDILNGLKSTIGGGGNQNEIVSSIINLIGVQSGGLNGLVRQFTNKGMGNLISSWIGTGQNLPISSSQLNDVLSFDTIKNLSSKLGIDENTLTGHLSDLLPKVVDNLTPDGKIPDGDILNKGKSLLSELFG